MMKLNTSPVVTAVGRTRPITDRSSARGAAAAGRRPALGAASDQVHRTRHSRLAGRPGRHYIFISMHNRIDNGLDTGRADTRRSLAKSRTNRTCPATTHDPRRVRRRRTIIQIVRPWMHAAQLTNRTTSRPRTQSPASRVPPRVAYAACSLGRGVHHVHAALARPLHL